MLKRRHIYMFVAALALLGTSMAADIAGGSSSSSSGGKTDIDQINTMLEYNQRMVSLAEGYLRDRAKIPADYQAASDKEFLRRAKLEKPGIVKKAAPMKSEKAETPMSKKK